MKSIIYVTTPTSGSQSIWRVLCALLPDYKLGDINPSTRLTDLNPEGHLYMARGIKELDGGLISPKFRYIGNFRDPRDMLCNQYHWLVQHPANASDPEKAAQIAKERKARHDLGIDASVLKVRNDRVFTAIYELQEYQAKNRSEVLFISYAQLCCAFDTMIDNLKAYLGTQQLSPKSEKAIALERPENLSDNKQWIGNQWFGTDIMPGRFRNELKAETISTLNARFKDCLERLKSIETPALMHLYD